MTEARLVVNEPATQLELVLQIDLLRAAGSSESYWRLSQSLRHEQHHTLWHQLASAIYVEQLGQRIELQVTEATAPQDQTRDDYFDPLVWPKLEIRLQGELFDSSSPLRATFQSQFVFEEPIALTQQHGGTRRSRWLVSDQMGPWLPLAGTGVSDVAQNDPMTLTRWVEVARHGFQHILPYGVDHLMLLLALLLMASRWQHIVGLVSVFTLGHSVTLLVVALRLVELNSVLVEVFILLSISTFAGLSLLKVSPRFAYGLVFPIGLLHGLGFGAGLIELNITDHLLWNIFAFNAGIEIAQLVFILLVVVFSRVMLPIRARLDGWRGTAEWLLLLTPLGASLVYLM